MYGRSPQMRQNFPDHDFTRRLASRDLSPSVLVCVVLASGAAFGMAAQVALQHLGLDFGTIRDDLIADHVAKSRSALAWWAWWLVLGAAFLVGPLSARFTRICVANWWRMRGLRLTATAAAVLGLAAIGAMRPPPSTLGFTTDAILGLLVVTASTVLAGLGAFVLGGLHKGAPASRPMRRPARSPDPLSGLMALPAGRPLRGGGSANSGLPFLRFRHRHALAPGYYSLGRLTLVAVLALVVFAAVSLVGGVSMVLDAVAPNAMRELVPSNIPAQGAADAARNLVLALLPTEPRRRVVLPPVVWLDAPPVKPVEPPKPPEPRQRAISAAVGYGGPVAENELTFTKGYSRRRAAQLAASMTSLPSIPQLTAAINIKRIRAASLRFTQQERRASRTAAENRYYGDNRRYADNRFPGDHGFADSPRRASRHSRAHNGYVDYNSSSRHGRHDRRRRAGERYGNSRLARADAPYRRF